MADDGYRVYYARPSYGDEEWRAVERVLDDPENLVGGDATEELERRVADLLGKDHGLMVNSGSSANLLAVEALDLDPGAEVVTPLVTFSTTVAPLVQTGLVPVFVDVGVGDYLVDVASVPETITDDTAAILVPSLLGNVPDYPRLREIADDHDLYLLEDSADTLGATVRGQPAGSFSDVSTTSFYGSHVVTAFGTGGLVAVDDEAWYRRLKKLRGWGRASAVDEPDDIDERLETSLDGIRYDSKFVFDEVGYNFLPTEASAAFGVEQVKKLDEFAERRRAVFDELRSFFGEYREWFVLPEQRDDVDTTWLAFPLTVRDEAPFDRNELVRYFERTGIQTRSLWSGNLLKHPGFADVEARLPFDEYPNADRIMRDAFVVGAHQSMTDDDVEYVKTAFREFVDDR